MSLEDINNAAAAMNAMTDRINSFMSDVDADVAEKRAAYQGLVNDLNVIVGRQMLFSGTVDPDLVDPTNVDGGTFNTIKKLCDAAPVGAYVVADLVAEKTHHLDDSIALYSKTLDLRSTDTDLTRPVVQIHAYTSSTHNQVYEFRVYGGGRVIANQVDFRFPTERVDPNLAWSARRCLVGYIGTETSTLSLRNANVSGGIPGVVEDNFGFVRAAPGTICVLMLDGVVVDGNIQCAYNVGSGMTFISRTNLTLVGEAVLTDGTEALGVDTLIA